MLSKIRSREIGHACKRCSTAPADFVSLRQFVAACSSLFCTSKPNSAWLYLWFFCFGANFSLHLQGLCKVHYFSTARIFSLSVINVTYVPRVSRNVSCRLAQRQYHSAERKLMVARHTPRDLLLIQHGECAGSPSSTSTSRTDQSFLKNAGCDLFCNVMDKSQAIYVIYA